MKQLQHRKGSRAPHGEPEYTERISFYCTAKQKKKFVSRGGSVWARVVIDESTVPKQKTKNSRE